MNRAKALWELSGGQRLRYAGAIAALCTAALLGYVVPQVVRITIDGVIANDASAIPAAARASVEWIAGPHAIGSGGAAGRIILAAGILVVLITTASGAFTYLRGRWAAIAAESIARRVRETVYDHLQRLPCVYFDRAETGDLVQRCTSDVETLRLFLSEQIVEFGRAVVMLVVVLPIMLAMDPPMTVVSLLVVPMILGFALAFFRRIRDTFKAADEAEGRMTALLQENLSGIRVVRAFARQDFECEKFAVGNAEYRDRFYRMIRLMGTYWATTDLITVGQIGAILMIGAWRVGTGSLSVGTLYAFLMYVQMLLWPVRMLGRILADLGKAHVAIGRLEEILEEPVEVDSPTPAVAPPDPFSGRIAIDGLSFAYNGETVLDDVSFEIDPGETVALLGPSGSGKSTLIHLVLRFYDYDRGAIRFDGVELRGLSRSWVRAQASVVLQEPFLYSRNLRENIGIGHVDAGAPEIEEAAGSACIHDSILEFEHGYDTLVGERGVTLSGGQRQRVAIARALLRDAPLLVLDDALSAVDTRTEQSILAKLDERRGRRTSIVIAHRLSTLARADRIVVLDHGRVAQIGSHTELLAEDGLYRRLWQYQGALEAEVTVRDSHADRGSAAAGGGSDNALSGEPS